MNSTTPFIVGKCYVIRTVTMINIGKVKEIIGDFLVLESAGWIADTGRYADMLSKGSINEFEPYPDFGIVGLGAIVDAQPWSFELPRSQK